MFTVNDGPLKDFKIEDPALKAIAGGDFPELVLDDVSNCISLITDSNVTAPDEAEFVAAVPESHRKSEKAYHVKAFRGSKDGRYMRGEGYTAIAY